MKLVVGVECGFCELLLSQIGSDPSLEIYQVKPHIDRQKGTVTFFVPGERVDRVIGIPALIDGDVVAIGYTAALKHFNNKMGLSLPNLVPEIKPIEA